MRDRWEGFVAMTASEKKLELVVRLDGVPRHFEISMVRLSKASFAGYLLFVKERNDLHELLEGIPSGAAWFSTEGEFLGANQRLLETFHPDTNPERFLHSEHNRELRDRWERFVAKTESEKKLELDVRSDGVPRHFEI